MATITQNVESFDKITVTITASSGSTVSFVSETDCTVTPKATKTSPAVFIITGFSGSSYTASFTDESAGTLDVTGSVSSTGGWISDTEQFVMRAEYNSQPVDLKYTVVKSKDGDVGVDGSDGSDGDQGKQVTNGTVFLTVPQASQPSAPSATAYNFGTQTFTGLTANWSLERPTISAGNANNFWEAAFNVEETTAGGGTGVPTFQNPPVRVQDGFGDSITENVVDINAASTKWVGVDNVSFTEDATNAVQPRSSTEYKYTYNATGGSEEYAVGAANTDKGWFSTTHTFYAGDTAVANIIIRHIAEPFPVGGVQDTQKVKSVYYEFEVIGSPASTYSTESNYSISLNGTTLTESWVGGGSPVANTYDQIQDYDQATAGQAYIITIQHTPTNAVKSVFVQYSGIVDSNITIDGGNYGK